MQWIAQTEKDADSAALEHRLWDAVDLFSLESCHYSRRYPLHASVQRLENTSIEPRAKVVISTIQRLYFALAA